MANDKAFKVKKGLQIQDSSGGEFVGLQAPSVVSSSYTLSLPAATGSAGQILQTNGSGQLSFITPSGGAYEVVSDTFLNNTYVADFTVTANYQYTFEIDSLQNTGSGGSALLIRYSTDGGSTWVVTDFGILRNGRQSTATQNYSGSSNAPPISYFNVPQALSSNETFQGVYYYSQRAGARGTLFGDNVGTANEGREYVQHKIPTSSTVNLIRIQSVAPGYNFYGRIRLLRRS